MAVPVTCMEKEKEWGISYLASVSIQEECVFYMQYMCTKEKDVFQMKRKKDFDTLVRVSRCHCRVRLGLSSNPYYIFYPPDTLVIHKHGM